jgi:hypothetical protein
MIKNITMVNKIANNIGFNFLQKSDILSNFDIISPLVVLVNFLWGIRSDDRGIDSIPPTPLYSSPLNKKYEMIPVTTRAGMNNLSLTNSTINH